MSLGGFGMCLDGSGVGPGMSSGGFVMSFGGLGICFDGSGAGFGDLVMGCGNFGTCSGGLLMARVNCNLGSSGISMCPATSPQAAAASAHAPTASARASVGSSWVLAALACARAAPAPAPAASP